MTPAPKITVIIPTRERHDTLRKCLMTVVTQDYDPLQIIVSDNFSADATADVVHSFDDPRLCYLNTGRRLSMAHNWEFALSRLDGGWVTILGDDDGLLPGSLHKVAELIRTTDLAAIRSDVCSFSWPQLLGTASGRLSVPLGSGVEIRRSRDVLERVMRGATPYAELPMLYNGGFVRADVVDQARRHAGTFYRSSTPDVFSGVLIASMLDRHLYVREPLAINGGSQHSTGTSTFKAEASAQSPLARFMSEGNIPFHPALPLDADGRFPPLIALYLYESYLQCADVHGNAIGVSPADQLALVLADPGRHADAVAAWAPRFAARHGLDLAEVQRAATRRQARLRWRARAARLARTLACWGAGSADHPLRDVYEASIAASTILGIQPGRLANIRRLSARVAGRRRAA